VSKRKILTGIFSILLALAIVLSAQILKFYDKGSLNIGKYMHFNLRTFIIVVIFSVIFYILFRKIFIKLTNISFITSTSPWNSKKVFIISTLLIFLSGLLFLLYCYPGVAMVDSYQLLIDPIGYSFQYPLVYSILSSKLFNLFYNLFGSMNIAFFIISLLQLIILSFILGYTIKWLHNKFKSNKVTLLTILYFNFFFIFSNLNIAHLRDSFFCVFFIVFITIIYDIIDSKGEYLNKDNFIIKFIITITCLLLSRNNGIFIISVMIIYFFIKFYKYYKRLLIILFVFIFISCVPKLLPNNSENTLFQESVAVPFQQIVYSIKYGNVSIEDQEVISEIIPVEIAKAKFSGFDFDRLKWGLMFNNFVLNEKKNKFIHVWLKNMIPNFKLYTKAFLVNNCDLWAFLPFKYSQGTILQLHEKDIVGYQFYSDLNNERILPKFIYNILHFIYQKYCFYFNNGFLFWMYFFLVVVLIYKNKKKFLSVFLPFFLIWINLIFMSPYACAFRYMAMFGYCLPFILCIVFYKKIDCNIE